MSRNVKSCHAPAVNFNVNVSATSNVLVHLPWQLQSPRPCPRPCHRHSQWQWQCPCQRQLCDVMSYRLLVGFLGGGRSEGTHVYILSRIVAVVSPMTEMSQLQHVKLLATFTTSQLARSHSQLHKQRLRFDLHICVRYEFKFSTLATPHFSSVS